MRAALLAIATVIGVTGCGTEGAVLELELELPASGACGADHAAVRAVFERDLGGDGACPAEEWAAGDCIADIALGDARTTSRISVVATENDVDQPLCVRVLFGAAGCAVGGMPPGTATLRVHPAFRDAGYTELSVAIADACTREDLGVLAAMPIP